MSQNIYFVCTVKIICGIGSRSDVDCTQTVFFAGSLVYHSHNLSQKRLFSSCAFVADDLIVSTSR